MQSYRVSLKRFIIPIFIISFFFISLAATNNISQNDNRQISNSSFTLNRKAFKGACCMGRADCDEYKRTATNCICEYSEGTFIKHK